MDEKYKGLTLRVDKDDSKVGSGAILKSKNNYYVVTAFHCIGDYENATLSENIEVWDNIEEDKVLFVINEIYYFTEENTTLTDLAIIKLENTVTFKNQEHEISNLFQYKNNNLILQTKARRVDFLEMVGYPKFKRDNTTLSLEMDSFELINFSSNKNKFKISDIKSYSGRTNSRLDGYSGSGCFEEKGDLIILDGIFTEYDNTKKIGEGISSLKIIELFERCDLEKPTLLAGYIESKIREKLEIICEKELEDRSLQEVIDNFRSFIETSINELDKFISDINLEDYGIDLDEYIEYTLVTLYLLEHYKIRKSIDNNTKSLIINKFSSKPFIKKETESRKKFEGKLERFKVNEITTEKERVYIKGFQGEEFDCTNCKYESKKGILSKIIPQKEGGLFWKKKEENIKMYCGDCIKLNAKSKLNTRVEKLWG